MELQRIFSEVADFRVNRRKLYLLSDTLVISLCAVISGANDFEDIAEYRRQKEGFLSKFLSLANRIPSHDTFNRVFRYLDSKSFGSCLAKWSSIWRAIRPSNHSSFNTSFVNCLKFQRKYDNCRTSRTTNFRKYL